MLIAGMLNTFLLAAMVGMGSSWMEEVPQAVDPCHQSLQGISLRKASGDDLVNLAQLHGQGEALQNEFVENAKAGIALSEGFMKRLHDWVGRASLAEAELGFDVFRQAGVRELLENLAQIENYQGKVPTKRGLEALAAQIFVDIRELEMKKDLAKLPAVWSEASRLQQTQALYEMVSGDRETDFGTDTIVARLILLSQPRSSHWSINLIRAAWGALLRIGG